MPQYVLYAEGGTILHRLDPRTKMLLVASVFIWTLVFNHPLYTATVFLGVLGLLALSKTLHRIKAFFFGLTMLAITSLVLWPIFRSRGEVVLLNLFGVNFYYEAVLYGVAVAFRLVAMVLSGLLLLTTTRIEELEAGLTRLGLPYPFAFGFSSVFRFIPTLVGDGMTILAAQQARGVNLMSGNLLTKLRKSATIIVPLFITTMRRFGELPMAIESRGFVPTAKRTFYIELKASKYDYFVSALLLVIVGLTLYLRLQGYGAVFPDVI